MSISRFTPTPWSESSIWELLRFGSKNSGGWNDSDNDDGYLPDEDDAPLIKMAPELYVLAEKFLEYLEAELRMVAPADGHICDGNNCDSNCELRFSLAQQRDAVLSTLRKI